MAFALHQRALFALLALSGKELSKITALMERIEGAPLDYTHAIRIAPKEIRELICRTGQFRIVFSILSDGQVFVHDILIEQI